MKLTWLGMGQLPHPQRTAAVAMVLLQCAALAEMMQATVFATLAAAIALGGWLAAQYRFVRTIHKTRWLAFLVLAFASKYSLTPEEFSFELEFINTPLSYEVACFFVAVQLSVLFARQYAEKLPLWLPGAAGAALVFSADVRVTSWTRTVMLVIVALHCMAMGWFSSASRRPVTVGRIPRNWLRGLIAGSCLGLAVFVGSSGSILIHRYEQELERMLARLLAAADGGIPSYAGFSDSGGLHDVTDRQLREGNLVALRVLSDASPGYLRGRVFDRFERDRWLATISPHPASRVSKEPFPKGPREDDNAFRVRSSEGPYQLMDIWPDESESSRVLFLPPSTSVVMTTAGSLEVDLAQSTTRPPGSRVGPYTAVLSTKSGSGLLRKEFFGVYLLVPHELDRRIPLLAAAIMQDAADVREKIERIESYFQSNYKYQIINRGRREHGESVLPEFLFDDHAGHCEYFATASVLLLRLSGVPARYVTGFVAAERNEAGGFWVARRKHAHAWAEAYDPVSGQWLVVESTPESGLPNTATVSRTQQRREALAFWWDGVRQRIRRWRPKQLLSIFTSPWLLLGAVAVAALAAGSSLVSWRPGSRRRWNQTEEGNPLLVGERRQMDRIMASRGLRRRDHETISQFADRIAADAKLEWERSAAEWYRRYVYARFSGEQDDATVKNLRDDRRNVIRLHPSETQSANRELAK